VCKKNPCPQSPLKTPSRRRNCFKSMLAYISGMLRKIFFTFEMWPALSGGHLHCKLGFG